MSRAPQKAQGKELGMEAQLQKKTDLSKRDASGICTTWYLNSINPICLYR